MTAGKYEIFFPQAKLQVGRTKLHHNLNLDISILFWHVWKLLPSYFLDKLTIIESRLRCWWLVQIGSDLFYSDLQWTAWSLCFSPHNCASTLLMCYPTFGNLCSLLFVPFWCIIAYWGISSLLACYSNFNLSYLLKQSAVVPLVICTYIFCTYIFFLLIFLLHQALKLEISLRGIWKKSCYAIN